MVNMDIVTTEKGLRTTIKKNLNKEIHPATKPSIDHIFKILDDAWNSGIHYDVSDMYPAVMAFAANSTNKADYCSVGVSFSQSHDQLTIPVTLTVTRVEGGK